MAPEPELQTRLASETPAEKAERQEYDTAAYLFNIVEAQITRADTKAGLVIAADSVFATALLLVSRGTLLALFSPTATFAARLNALAILAIFVLLLISTLAALIATRPALKVRNDEGTLFFFGRISRMDHTKFVETFALQETHEMRHAILTEVHNTSQIAARKFRLMRVSIDCLIGAVSLWVILQVLYGLTPA